MYSVTDAFNAACAAPGREITSKILFNGTTELAASDVQEISITEQFGSSDGVTIGAAFSSQCKVVIYKQTPALPFSGGNFTPYAGIMVDGAAQFAPKGKFYIPSDGVEKTGDLWLTITGYDRMAGLTAEYVPTIQFPATPTQMLVDVCTQAHVTAPSVTMPDIQIATPYSGSLRQQLGWLAGLIGCNAKFDATGNLVFCWYADNGLTLGWDVQYMDGLELTADGAFTINSLLTGTEENPISVGTGLGITSTNPYMTAEQAAVVLAQISGKSLMPCKLKWRGNPAVESGDSVTVTGRDGKALTVYVMEQRMTIKGGMSADITCHGPEDAEYAVESPTQKKVQQQYNDVRKAFRDATERIIGAKGGYFEITYDDDGFPTGWVIRNTPSVEDDTKMWIMSAGGLGYSSDGGKTVTDIALTDDGKILGSALIIKQDDVDGLSAALSAINGELTSKITRAEAESEIKQTADALIVRITGLDDDLQLITKSFHVGDDGLVIGETDNPIKLRLDNDTLQFLRDNVAELEITADGVVAKRLTVSTIMIGEVLIQADDNGDVIIA